MRNRPLLVIAAVPQARWNITFCWRATLHYLNREHKRLDGEVNELKRMLSAFIRKRKLTANS